MKINSQLHCFYCNKVFRSQKGEELCAQCELEEQKRLEELEKQDDDDLT